MPLVSLCPPVELPRFLPFDLILLFLTVAKELLPNKPKKIPIV